ncbi:DUF6355 family natural product biosynthesis protein [Allokutzneria sp. NRRL B-24872]|uniref:DUF6355 family natural product biosynthesis protein n=1 Tax=Allokutzneria sp. NRRL B-24872 TaxID=1137961 RepID=UPI00117836C2|nr:DUF6355 family natural product biosynthesis protein [Allokutzneria sp. NRRL B-24872]
MKLLRADFAVVNFRDEMQVSYVKKLGVIVSMRLLSAALVLCASAIGLAGTANAAESAMAGHPCGYFVINNNAYYNHCGPSNVLVHIEKVFGDDEECLPPGVTPIGLQPWTYGAYYVRPC